MHPAECSTGQSQARLRLATGLRQQDHDRAGLGALPQHPRDDDDTAHRHRHRQQQQPRRRYEHRQQARREGAGRGGPLAVAGLAARAVLRAAQLPDAPVPARRPAPADARPAPAAARRAHPGQPARRDALPVPARGRRAAAARVPGQVRRARPGPRRAAGRPVPRPQGLPDAAGAPGHGLSSRAAAGANVVII
ncbi:hypothetical protein FOCC_FOCC006986 [Frankliniella occidentalis]|nr:hypothetical protein FOCC_FOCC006986 [Frankliniella occidentalis]